MVNMFRNLNQQDIVLHNLFVYNGELSTARHSVVENVDVIKQYGLRLIFCSDF